MKVRILMGQICSGMTAYSHSLAKNEGYIRISIDDIKKMMWPHLKIVEGKRIDDTISAIVERWLQVFEGLDDEVKIVIDGFPMEWLGLKYLISCFDIELTIFTVNLLRANIKNRKREHPIDPEEIREYNNEFLRWVKLSSEFNTISKMCKITYMENYEPTRKLNLVM